jgi:hypothetical protein
MEDKQAGKAKTRTLAPKDPAQDREDATYYLIDGKGKQWVGMPATAFKMAIVGACRLFDGLDMTRAKVIFHVEGNGPDQLVPICVPKGGRQDRTDAVRNSNGGTDLRHRYSYFPWKATLTILYLQDQISVESVLALVSAAGIGGVGDWRPSKNGIYGRFDIDPTKQIEQG